MQRYTKSIMIRVAPSTYDKISHLTRIEDRTLSNMARVLINEALHQRESAVEGQSGERRREE